MKRATQLATLVALPVAIAIVSAVQEPGRWPWALLAGGLTYLAMRFRTSRPLIAVAIALTVQVGFLLLDGRPFGAIALLIAVYSLAATAPPWAVVTGGATAILISSGAEVLGATWFGDDPNLVAVFAVILAGLTVGLAVRNYRSYLKAADARATAAELQADEEARRRIAEDRVRLSRELHDSVAHQLAVINVQTGVAKNLLSKDPERASAALDHVAEAARTAMSEAAAVITGLRNSTPAGGLDELCDGFIATGTDVQLNATLPNALDEPTRVLVYRIVQEGLTNARKHAPAAKVVVEAVPDGDRLKVSVSNSPAIAPTTATASGHGLLGLYERVTEAGGTFRAGPDAGGFTITAQLPIGVRT